MSAIAGILSFDGNLDIRGLVERFTPTMARRGPDGQAYWFDNVMAFGHCMLRTTPESMHENQPLLSHDKALVLVWDGRLDNRDELRRNLLSAGAVLRDVSDGEMVLQGYAIWGEECPKRLLGDFAFAIWDAKRKILFCARDPMGARPFYFVRNSKLFAFASEEEALVGLPGVSSKPNEDLIAYLLVPWFAEFDSSRAWLEDVRLIAPAHQLTVSVDGRMVAREYWKLEPCEENRYDSDEECHEDFLETFGEAVRCRMRSKGDISVMMSGGLDSASVATMAWRLLPESQGKRLHTYSAISDQPETCVETRSILSLVKTLRSEAHFLSVPSFTSMGSIRDLVEVAWAEPHPVNNSILLPSMMCLAAGRDGQRVMLHGASGDLTMQVPGRYLAYLMRAGKWRGLAKEFQGARRNSTYLQGVPLRLLIMRNLWTAFAPQRLRNMVRRLRAKYLPSPLAGSMIHADFAARMNLVGRMRASAWQESDASKGLQEMFISSVLSPHGIASGLSGFDRVAGRYGMELRDPWADRRVVEFWLRLPLEFKVRNGWTKYLVRSAFAGDFPPEVTWRKDKEHLGWTFTCRLLDETPDVIARVVENKMGVIGKYVDANVANERYFEYLSHKRDEGRKDMYDLATIALWLKRMEGLNGLP